MQKVIVNPWTWQDDYGYSQAIDVRGPNRILLCSAQGSFDGEGVLVHAGDMPGQVRQSLENLEAVLAKAGFGLADVVRLTMYSTDLDAFGAAFAAVGARLAETCCKAAQTWVGAARLATPDMLVLFEAMAMK
ncbi:MAG: RidA family protein [Chloroflexota bacterium]|nr:RidA family protein [Chloroflexota bacterium]